MVMVERGHNVEAAVAQVGADEMSSYQANKSWLHQLSAMLHVD